MPRDLSRPLDLVDVHHHQLLALGADPHPLADQPVRHRVDRIPDRYRRLGVDLAGLPKAQRVRQAAAAGADARAPAASKTTGASRVDRCGRVLTSAMNSWHACSSARCWASRSFGTSASLWFGMRGRHEETKVGMDCVHRGAMKCLR